MNIDKKEHIINLFEHWFSYGPKNRAAISVNDDGGVSFVGSCKLKYSMPDRVLPLTFEKIHGEFNCSDSNLTSLEGSPRIVNASFLAHNNPLQSLNDLPDSARYIKISYSQDLPLLRLLFVKNLGKIAFYPYTPEGDQVNQILSKYLGKGRGGALACAAELARAGFNRNARK